MQKALLWTIVIVLGATTAPGRAQTESAAPPPALSATEALWSLLTGATVEQRIRVSRFLTNKYPTLSKELFALISEYDPGFFAAIVPQLDHLVSTKYQGLPSLIHATLSQAPQVQQAVVELIREGYPELVADLRALEGDEDVRKRAAELIQQKYPALLGDVLTTITRKFPSLLQELQHEIIGKFPGLLADVARIITKNHPELSQKIFALMITKYPQLLPGVLAILTEPPAPPAETQEAASPPATLEPTP